METSSSPPPIPSSGVDERTVVIACVGEDDDVGAFRDPFAAVREKAA